MELTINHPQELSIAHEKLIDYVTAKSTVLLSNHETEVLERSFRYKRLRKHQFLFQEGEVCRFMAFVLNGSTRMFSMNEKGIEHIVNFGIEETWICDYESFNMLTPTAYHLQALEDTELLLISNEQLQYLFSCSPGINDMINLQEREQLILFQKRIHAAISMTAEEQYAELLHTSPEIVDRFSFTMIASYLGIAPETLSRIRKNMKIGSAILI